MFFLKDRKYLLIISIFSLLLSLHGLQPSSALKISQKRWSLLCKIQIDVPLRLTEIPQLMKKKIKNRLDTQMLYQLQSVA